MEYRQKPDNLNNAAENDAYDAFVGWFPCKHWSMVLAYAQLGSIANFDHQRGYYLSLSANF
jgi:hypothetical protein